MQPTLLNPEVINLSITSLPVMFVGLAAFALGLAVLIREQGSSIGLRYFSFAGSVGLYVFGAGVSYAVVPQELALLWERIAHIGVGSIPTTLLLASVAILGQKDRHRVWIASVASGSFLSVIFVVFTDLHIAGNRPVFWGWYPVYGPVGYAFVGLFSLVTVWVLLAHIREYRRQQYPLYRKRIGWSAVAIGVGLLGGADFLPAVGLSIYAFGFIPIFLFVAIMGAVVVRYRLVDITPQLAAAPILNTMHGAVIVTDLAGIIRVANTVAGRWLSTGQRALIDKPLEHVLRDRVLKVTSEAAKATGIAEPTPQAGSGPLSNGQYEWTAISGDRRMVDVIATPLRVGRERVGTVYTAHDVTPHKDTENALAELALHDAMTGLPNRVLLFERIEHEVELARRQRRRVAVLFIDLDQFKSVNDTFGHEAGDDVLSAVAKRLQSAVRSSDTVARIGGDEFVVVAGNIMADEDIENIVVKIEARVAETIEVSGAYVTVGASVGIALFPDDGEDPETLVRSADGAMYQKKGQRAAP